MQKMITARDLRNASHMEQVANETNEPIFVMKQSKCIAILMGIETYNRFAENEKAEEQNIQVPVIEKNIQTACDKNNSEMLHQIIEELCPQERERVLMHILRMKMK